MFDIQKELSNLPDKPGVYLMKNSQEEIIYVGKAKNLKNRVRQYFQSSANQAVKVKNMVRHIVEFEYIVTDTEKEALILECNLIKKHKPHYNILLKDDKMYPYIKITKDAFPKVLKTRAFVKNTGRYFGPYTDVKSLNEVLDLIYDIWPIRTCSRVLPRDIGKARPCLNLYIGKCCAPCNGNISQEDYSKYIHEVVRFLEGKHEEVLKKLEEKMHLASEELRFEDAAKYRNQIHSIQSLMEKQKMEHQAQDDQDIIAFARAMDEALVQVFMIRGGKMTGREHFMIKGVENNTRTEVMTEFVKQYYGGTPFIPREIILQETIEDLEIITSWLTEMRGKKVLLTVPQKGEKHRLVELAYQNASLTLHQFGEKIKKEQERTLGAVKQLSDRMGLTDIFRIEAYDISNIQGFQPVGSMVVFENGRPKRNDYRKFKIKSVLGPNDVASMEEVIRRRFTHGLKEREEMPGREGKFTHFPDLIMMDGGKNQIHAAQNVLAELGLDIPVCGLVKDDRHRTRDIIYNEEELGIDPHSEGFKLMTRIQDEVHRFAIEYHRKLRQKESIHSVLDEIDGIGPTRRKELLKKFGSVDRIRQASVAELSETAAMNEGAAQKVYSFFHP